MVTAIIPCAVTNQEFSSTLQNELSQLDQRIFSYVVLGRVLQAAGAALFIG